MSNSTASRGSSAIFSQDELHQLYAAIISAELDPNSLLNELDPDIRALVQFGAAPTADHVLAILSGLNRLRLVDGTIPFRTVLRTARLLAGPKHESRLLNEALSSIDETFPQVPLPAAPERSPKPRMSEATRVLPSDYCFCR